MILIFGANLSSVNKREASTSWPVAGCGAVGGRGGGGGCDNYYRTGQSNRQHPVPGYLQPALAD